MIFDIKILGYINTFEKFTRSRVKDCFIDDGVLTFIIFQGDLGKALGKKGETLRKASAKFKKKIKLIEFNSDQKKFILNLVYPLKPEVVITDDKIVIQAKNNFEKGKIFGREKENYKKLKELIKKYFKKELVLE
jgi:transcription termination/antitermination protein NusA